MQATKKRRTEDTAGQAPKVLKKAAPVSMTGKGSTTKGRKPTAGPVAGPSAPRSASASSARPPTQGAARAASVSASRTPTTASVRPSRTSAQPTVRAAAAAPSRAAAQTPGRAAALSRAATPVAGPVAPVAGPVARPSAGPVPGTSTPKPTRIPRVERAGPPLDASAIRRPVPPVVTILEDEFEPEEELLPTQREVAEGESQRIDELIEEGHRENTVLQERLQAEEQEVRLLRDERDAMMAQLAELARRIEEPERGEENDDEVVYLDEDQEEGELLEYDDEEEFEEPRDRTKDRNWLGELMAEARKNKEEKEADNVWVTLGKTKSTSSYVKRHWSTWTSRDCETDKERVEALLEMHIKQGGYSKMFGEILKSLSEIKLKIIQSTNVCNVAGKQAPHKAFSSLMLDLDSVGKKIFSKKLSVD